MEFFIRVGKRAILSLTTEALSQQRLAKAHGSKSIFETEGLILLALRPFLMLLLLQLLIKLVLLHVLHLLC